jgi:RNA polymerase sigma-70 factor (ECF subfamily)
MAGNEFLAEQFEANRGHLRAVAYRMLGSRAEADDAVQEAWLRLMRAGTDGVDNLGGWLTTVTARVCLDMLRERKSRRETPVDATAENIASSDDPEGAKQIADSIGAAMLVVLENLSPAERVAFVLHDVFAMSFEEIASVVGRSPEAARQLASRGRRRVQGAPATADADRVRRREVLDAFLAAARGGDFTALLAILDPNVVLRADAQAIAGNAARSGPNVPTLAPEIRGREAVAEIFRGRAKAALAALVDGDPGLVFAFGGQPRMVVDLVIDDGRIVELEMIAAPERIAGMNLEF